MHCCELRLPLVAIEPSPLDGLSRVANTAPATDWLIRKFHRFEDEKLLIDSVVSPDVWLVLLQNET